MRNGDLNLAWGITLLLLRKAQTDNALGYVAAGPLERHRGWLRGSSTRPSRGGLRQGLAAAICSEWYMALARQPRLATLAKTDDEIWVPKWGPQAAL